MRPRIAFGSLVVIASVLAACGDDDTASPATEAEPAATEAPIATEAPAVASTDPPTTDPPTTESASSGTEPAPVESTADEPATAEPPPEPTTTVAPTTTVPVAEIGGRAFAEAVEPESNFESNPLPDLVVDDVARGARSNLRNVFPADRPVLFWMYAPH